MCSPKTIQFNPEEMVLIDKEIKLLLLQEIIEKVKNSDEDDFMSNIFIRPKKNRKQRVILNLKRLNNCVEYHHFKMETLKAALSLIYLRIVTWRQLIYRMRIILVKSMLMTEIFFLNWQKNTSTHV